MIKIGIVGFGAVGIHIFSFFAEMASVSITIYDKYLAEAKDINKDKEDINACDFVFVCVPTPNDEEGNCDDTEVIDVLDWLGEKPYIIIKSTVPVCATENYVAKYDFKKKIIYSPEYYGETPNHPFAKPEDMHWITLGGITNWCLAVSDLYLSYNPNLEIRLVSSRVAELSKYMENAFLAVKVEFCNEFYDICENLGVDYLQLKETWLMDPRIGRSHTNVNKNKRGFDGKCLPKDLNAIVKFANDIGESVPVLATTATANKDRRKKVQ